MFCGLVIAAVGCVLLASAADLTCSGKLPLNSHLAVENCCQLITVTFDFTSIAVT